jgi:ferric-dicitrate binding protein FerR (iron transport regulator)
MDSDRLRQLLAAKWLGEASEQELEELEQLLKLLPEEHEKEQLLDTFFQQRQTAAPGSPKAKAAWQKHLENMNKEFPDDFAAKDTPAEAPAPEESRSARLFPWKRLVVAASVTGILCITIIAYLTKERYQRPQDMTAQPSPANRSLSSRTSIKKTLPDGTIVWLNGKSSIEYNDGFGKTKRDITLTGEAFFDVAHNAAVPLTVHAKTVNITVKGTAFNVKAYPEDSKVEASLIRGSIELAMKKMPGKKILLHPNEKITISTGETTNAGNNKNGGRYRSDQLYRIKELKTEPLSNLIPEISWMEHKLVFDSERFADIIPKMEKWYETTIWTSDTDLLEQRFSAVFEKETIEEALAALQFTYKFNFEVKDKQVFINKNKAM